MAYGVLIVEDEPAAASELTGLLDRYAEARGIELEACVAGSALDVLDARRCYDICLLDIDLPGINGMETARLLREQRRATEIIFVTNLAQFAVRGYEVDAIGFIVKPATLTSLSMNMDRALRDLERGAHRSIKVSTAEGARFLALEDLAYVEVRNHNLVYHLADGQTLEGRGSLAALYEQVGGAPLVKVSRYCAANMALISSIGASGVRLSTGEELHITHGHKRDVERALTTYLGGRR